MHLFDNIKLEYSDWITRQTEHIKLIGSAGFKAVKSLPFFFFLFWRKCIFNLSTFNPTHQSSFLYLYIFVLLTLKKHAVLLTLIGEA